jgi:DNA-binding response OmpR family regulator
MVKRILLVDDDPDILSTLQDYLEIHGHAVDTAENGREALTKLGQAGYDAVVTDCIMPELDGLGVLRHVRKNRPSLPVVMMTGESSGQRVVQMFVALGAQACLFKPFAPQELEEIMENL